MSTSCWRTLAEINWEYRSRPVYASRITRQVAGNCGHIRNTVRDQCRLPLSRVFAYICQARSAPPGTNLFAETGELCRPNNNRAPLSLAMPRSHGAARLKDRRLCVTSESLSLSLANVYDFNRSLFTSIFIDKVKITNSRYSTEFAPCRLNSDLTTSDDSDKSDDSCIRS